MYIASASSCCCAGFSDAIMMRLQQAMARRTKYQRFTYAFTDLHCNTGTIMIFFVAIPLVVGLVNFVMPLQIGACDVAFPFLTI